MQRLVGFSALFLGYLVIFDLSEARSACLNVQSKDPVALAGTLSFHIFGGPPYNGGVAKGDTPEPTYTLKLDEPICIEGYDFLESGTKVDRVQVYPDYDVDQAAAIFAKLRGLVGARVKVQGKSAFGAHTGHHHAPLMLPINAVYQVTDSTEAYGTAVTTVQAFYLALGAGRGEEAVRFVVPEKRRSGPFSAEAITKFYGSLVKPLTVSDVAAVSENEYRVRYTFVAPRAKRCDGEALVRTVRLRDENLIYSIKALNGC
jgi:hypothetical protein